MGPELHGRRALVVGAGRSIGRAVAIALAGAGAGVVAVARTEAEVARVAAEIRAGGGEARHAVCDVTSWSDVAALAAAVRPIDILVNVAGAAPGATLLETENSVWEGTLLINLTAPFWLTKLLVPDMIGQKWGRVINVASILSKTAFPNTVAYTASKHGVLGLTRAVAVEVARHGVTVNAICPGYVDTALTQAHIATMAQRSGKSTGDVTEALARTSPQRRLIEAEEVAYLAVMLCGHAARGVNGQALTVDGGGVLA